MDLNTASEMGMLSGGFTYDPFIGDVVFEEVVVIEEPGFFSEPAFIEEVIIEEVIIDDGGIW
jgi:hypothetical protein